MAGQLLPPPGEKSHPLRPPSAPRWEKVFLALAKYSFLYYKAQQKETPIAETKPKVVPPSITPDKKVEDIKTKLKELEELEKIEAELKQKLQEIEQKKQEILNNNPGIRRW